MRAGCVVAGNCVLSIKRDALTAQGIGAAADEASLDGYLLAPTDATQGPVPVTGVAFPTIATGARRTVRPISSAKTQQLLYENALSQLDTEQLSDEHGAPIGLSTPVEGLLQIARETATLAASGGALVAGSAEELWTWLAESSQPSSRSRAPTSSGT